MRTLLSKLGEQLRNPRFLIPAATAGGVSIAAGGGWLIFQNWLAALILALVVILVALVLVLLRTIFSQEREHRLDRGIADRERATEFGASGRPTDLEGSFRRALIELRGSVLGRDAVDALPWLLVLGESGSGKSEALRRSGLDVPAQYLPLVGAGPTLDCDWWLTNQAVVLDSAGRFADADTGEIRKEWRRLLQLLGRQRRSEGLNGVVIAVPVTTLLGAGADEVEERGRILRRRINDLADTLGFDIPIYVLVTKADLIDGFVEAVSALGWQRAREALGWTNSRRRFADAAQIAAGGFEPLRERLSRILPELLLRETDGTRRRRIFLFPHHLDEVLAALERFLRATFAPSAYDDVPFLRGVYLTSARQEGTTFAPVPQRLGHDWARTQLGREAGESRPAFLHDVFREIVVADRDLALPSSWMGPRTRRWVVGSVALASLGICGTWAISFVDHLTGIRRLATEAGSVAAGASSLAAIERLREAVLSESEDRPPLGGFGFAGPLDVALDRSRHTFAWAFEREFEAPTKDRLIGQVRSYAPDSFGALATLALDVTYLGAPEGRLSPDLTAFAPVGRDEADLRAFREGYTSFVKWSPEQDIRQRIERERDVVVAAAPRLLDLKQLDEWSRFHTAELPPARYSDVGLHGDSPTGEVLGAYTLRGWEDLVRDLIDSVERTGGVSGSSVSQFREEYVTRFDASWRGYLLDTPREPRAERNVTGSPYVALIEQIDRNMRAALPRRGSEPTWVAALRQLRREEPLEKEETLPPWGRYRAALEQGEADVAAVMDRGDHALDLARKVAAGGTSFESSIALIRELVPTEGDPQATEQLRAVLAMPLLDGVSAMLSVAMEHLDLIWRDRIAQPFASRFDAPGLVALYGPGGSLERFRAELLERFYADGRSTPVLVDRGLPLGPEFLAWMASAEEVRRHLFPAAGVAPDLSVRLEGVPSRVVGLAGTFVTRRDLRVVCDEVQTFVYQEGVGTHTFQWSPRCEEVSLRIWARSGNGEERELLPRKEWTGPLALPRFLQEGERLPGGRLEWRLSYPDAGGEVVAAYRLRGGEGLLRIAHRAPPTSLRD